MNDWLVAIFSDTERAWRTVLALRDAGFDHDNLFVIEPTDTRAPGVSEIVPTPAQEAPRHGVPALVRRLLVGLGGAEDGSQVGAFADHLAGLGLSRDVATEYAEKVLAGDIVVLVGCDNRCEEAERLLTPAAPVHLRRLRAALAMPES